jgi:hypothetical protein
VHVVCPVAGRPQVGQHAPQRCLPQPADRLRGEIHPLSLARQEALVLQLPLQPAQLVQLVGRPATQRALHCLLVDVVEPRTGIVLAERGLQLVEVGEVLQCAGALAHAEGLVAAHLRAPGPVEVGSS